MGWLDEPRADRDDEPRRGSQDSPEAIKRHKAQQDRSKLSRERLIREAVDTFETSYRDKTGTAEFRTRERLGEGPRLHRSFDPGRGDRGVMYIQVPVDDSARVRQLESQVQELEVRLRAEQASHPSEPSTTPFNPVRITTRRKIAVDE